MATEINDNATIVIELVRQALVDPEAETPSRPAVEIGLGSRLVEDLQLDSLAMMSLAIELEKRFDVHLEEVDENTPETIGDLVSLLESKQS